MTLFFPDLNVWMALSVAEHVHSPVAWKWLSGVSGESRLIWTRYTQIGLLRLLTNTSVMGDQTLTLRKAWNLYDRWSADPRAEFYPEPRNVDRRFRETTEPFAAQRASKWVGDCWLLAFAVGAQATLVTFDRALFELAQKQRHPSVIPA